MASGTTKSGPTLDWDSPNLAKAYKMYKAKIQMHLKIKKVEDAETQVCHLIQGMGDKGIELLQSFKMSAADEKDLKKVCEKFDNLIEGAKVHPRIARLDLRRMTQTEGETTSEFISRLKVQADLCELGDQEYSERIIEQIILSTPIADYQKHLLEQKIGYKLEEVEKEARVYEAQIANAKKVGNPNIKLKDPSVAIGAMNNKRCTFCNGPWHKKLADCPVYIKKKSSQKSHERDRQSKPRRKNRRRHNSTRRHGQVTCEDSYDEEDEGELHQFHKIRISSSNVNTEGPTTGKTEAYTEVILDDKEVWPGSKLTLTLKPKLDTGTEANTLPLRCYNEMERNKSQTVYIRSA